MERSLRSARKRKKGARTRLRDLEIATSFVSITMETVYSSPKSGVVTLLAKSREKCASALLKGRSTSMVGSNFCRRSTLPCYKQTHAGKMLAILVGNGNMGHTVCHL